MYTKSITVLALAATAFAAPQNLGDIAASLTSQFGGAIPTDLSALTSGLNLGSLTSDLAGLTSELAAATSALNILSDLPTLPTSVLAVLQTAVPLSDLTRTEFACSATAASWYNNLPADVKSALISYQSAAATWAAGHSSLLGQYTGDLSVPVCTGAAAGGASGNQASTTRGSGSPTSAAGGNTVSSSTQGAGAAHATAIVGSLAGVVGALGVMLAL